VPACLVIGEDADAVVAELSTPAPPLLTFPFIVGGLYLGGIR